MEFAPPLLRRSRARPLPDSLENPSVRGCHTPNTFRPCGFSPLRRLAPMRELQTCCSLVPDLRFATFLLGDHVTDPKIDVGGRRAPRSALIPFEGLLLAGSRSASLRPLPPCRLLRGASTGMQPSWWRLIPSLGCLASHDASRTAHGRAADVVSSIAVAELRPIVFRRFRCAAAARSAVVCRVAPPLHSPIAPVPRSGRHTEVSARARRTPPAPKCRGPLCAPHPKMGPPWVPEGSLDRSTLSREGGSPW